MIKYFDSLIHASRLGLWPSSKADIGLSSVLNLLRSSSHLSGGIIQDSPWFGSELSQHDLNLVAINELTNSTGTPYFYSAGLPYASRQCLYDYIDQAFDQGVRIFKVHPRFSRLTSESTTNLISYILARQARVQLCTYGFSASGQQLFLSESNFWSDLLSSVQDAPPHSIMLMHMGATDLFYLHSLIRHCPQFLGDLSMTLLKYPGSHIDSDIKFLFHSFDRRICIGSDYPEFTPQDVSSKLVELLPDYQYNPIKYSGPLVENALTFCKSAYSNL